MSRSVIVAALALLAAPLGAQGTAPPPFKPFTAEETARYTALGKKVTQWFFEGQADSILAISTPETANGMGGIDGIRRQMDLVAERAGTPLKVLAEKMTRRQGTPQFWWEAEMSNFTDEPMVLRWLFNEEGKLAGAGMGPKSRAPSDPES